MSGVNTHYTRMLFVVLALTVCAAWSGLVVAQDNGRQNNEISLRNAIQMALETSADIKKAELAAALLELEYKQAKVNAQMSVTELELETIQQQYENARFQIQLEQSETARQVESQYYAVMKAIDRVALRESALERAERQMDVSERRHTAGQITQVQLRETEQLLKEAQLAYRSALHTLQLDKLELSRLLGLYHDDFVLTENVTFSPLEVDIEEAITNAKNNRFEVIQAQQELERQRQMVRLADDEYTPPIQLESATIRLEQAEIALEQIVDKIESEVWQMAIALDEAEARYEIAQDELDLAIDNLDLEELRYENGLNTLLDVFAAEAKLAEVEVNAMNTIYDYNIALAEYLSAVGLGLARWPELQDLGMEGIQ